MTGLALQLTCVGAEGFRLQLDCELPDRGITAIYGSSGSGKSTLLDCIAGLRIAEPGSCIRFRDEHWQQGEVFAAPWQRNIGYVFQDARLFPHLDVRGNLEFALQRRKREGLELADAVRLLELGALMTRFPTALSAGQKQRVALARALLGAPRLLLLDEPLANLDTAASSELLAHLQRLQQDLDLPMLYVSHDIEEVSQLADYLLLLDGGSAVAQGPLLELCSALDNRLSREEQAAAINRATIVRHDTEYALTELDMEGQPIYVSQLQQEPGRQRRLRIPARHVSICRQKPDDSSILNILSVTVSEIEPGSGPVAMLRLAIGSQFLLARITRKSLHSLDLKVGDAVYAQVKSAALLVESVDNS